MSRLITSARWQFSTLAIWILIGLAALPMALKVNEELEAQARLKDSESARVETTLKERFESPFARIALLRVAALPSPRTPEGGDLLKHMTDALESTPGVKGVISYLTREDTLFVGKDESSILHSRARRQPGFGRFADGMICGARPRAPCAPSLRRTIRASPSAGRARPR